MAWNRALVYPKEFPANLLYLKSPVSNVVHLCHEAIGQTAMPLCGVWCWNRVVPTLPEELEGDNLRFCKNCLASFDYLEDYEFIAKRTDFVHLQHCSVKGGE